jgi:transaldolase
VQQRCQSLQQTLTPWPGLPFGQRDAPSQGLWIDNISHDMLEMGTLARYIAEFSVTGLTSNPTIFEHAIGQDH